MSQVEQDSRMDGSREQQYKWRIQALREALLVIGTVSSIAGCQDIAKNAISVDNLNQDLMERK